MPALITEGQDWNRSTGAGYSRQEADVVIKSDIQLYSVRWDIRVSTTYTLSIAGTDQKTQALTGGSENEIVLPSLLVLATGTYRFKLRMASSFGWNDRNASTFSGTYWSSSGIYYNDTFYANYSLPIKLVFYLIDKNKQGGVGGGAGGGKTGNKGRGPKGALAGLPGWFRLGPD